MRSAVFAGAGQPLAIVDRPMPRPGRHQALIRVERCGICGSDLHMTSGSAFDVAHGTPLGHEYAGEVVELGEECGTVRLGDRVVALPISGCGECPACLAHSPLHCGAMAAMQGGYGEYTLVDTRHAVRLPATVGFAEGALAEPLASALRGVRRAGPLAGARIAVIGAGAIGSASVFWARRLGADRIVAIARTRRNADLAHGLGATAFETVGDDLAARVTERLGGAPDIVVEGAGATGAIGQAIDLVRIGGTVLSLGGCIHADPILPAVAMFKDITLRFSVAYGLPDFVDAVGALEAEPGVAAAMIADTIPLSVLPARFEAMRHGSPGAKVMVHPHAA